MIVKLHCITASYYKIWNQEKHLLLILYFRVFYIKIVPTVIVLYIVYLCIFSSFLFGISEKWNSLCSRAWSRWSTAAACRPSGAVHEPAGSQVCATNEPAALLDTKQLYSTPFYSYCVVQLHRLTELSLYISRINSINYWYIHYRAYKWGPPFYF